MTKHRESKIIFNQSESQRVIQRPYLKNQSEIPPKDGCECIEALVAPMANNFLVCYEWMSLFISSKF